MLIIPLENRIIVRLAQPVSQAGAASAVDELPADATVRGLVIAAGAGRIDDHGRHVPLGVAAGDIILFKKHLGREITFSGIQCWLLDAADILKIEPTVAIPLLRSKELLSRH